MFNFAQSEDDMQDKKPSGTHTFFWGAALGALTALLLAPKNGRETRKRMKEEMQTMRQRLKRKADDATDLADDALQRADDVVERIKEAKDAPGQKDTLIV